MDWRESLGELSLEKRELDQHRENILSLKRARVRLLLDMKWQS